MNENRREEALLVRAEPLVVAKEISHKMVDAVRVCALRTAHSCSRSTPSGLGQSKPCW
jgi:hypothetical protein